MTAFTGQGLWLRVLGTESVSEHPRGLRLRLQLAVHQAGPGLDREAPVKGCIENLVQAAGRHEAQVLPHVAGKLFEVLLVPLRDDDPLQARPVCRQHFVFDSTHLDGERRWR